MSEFGPALRSEWLLDPAVTYLNHGTVGSPPRKVLEYQWQLTQLIERQPARFMNRELADAHGTGAPSRMRAAASEVAPFVGCAPDEFLFVDNITEGANAVLKSYPLGPGDQVFVTSLGYGGVTKAAEFAARQAGAEFHQLTMPPLGTPGAGYVAAIVDGLAERPGTGTRILVVDHISSQTALLLPLAEIAVAAHAAGCLVLADGAHVPGQLPLDVPALGVDWYAANLHKWAWTPRTAGFLWASPAQRPHLRPVVTSWGLDLGLTAEFDLPGTHDPTAFLAAPFAIELMRSYGLDAVYAYNHELAWWAGQFLSDSWGVPFTTPEELIGAMVTVRLPDWIPATAEAAADTYRALEDAGIEAPVYGPEAAGEQSLTLRVCAQVYNDRTDIDRLAAAVLALKP